MSSCGTEWQGSRCAFTTPRGRAIDPTHLPETSTASLCKFGLRRIRFHNLRHSTADLYAHILLRLQHQAIDTLGNALGTEDDGSDDPPAAIVVR
ncbi:hypothetical protein GCM10010388_69500 [Streptomyces mauvecolor]